MKAARVTVLVWLAALAACDGGGATTGAQGAPGAPGATAVPDRDAWWRAATTRASGRERILAPRELRALIAEGEAFGFAADPAWWSERRLWAFERILTLDPDDVESNRAAGRRTLQSIEGLQETWDRLLSSPPNEATRELIDRWDPLLQSGRPVFLTGEEYKEAEDLLRVARAHLDRLDRDPRYAALQKALVRVRRQDLSDYPFVHRDFGPFLVFLCARDLQRIQGEDEAEETKRLERQSELYLRNLDRFRDVYEGIVADVRELYPELWKRHPLRPDDVFYQWIFADRAWYGDLLGRLSLEEPESTYRCGFLHGATGWAYLYEPRAAATTGDDAAAADQPKPDQIQRETIAYLAASQLLRHWGKDPEVPITNHLDHSQAYWLKEGWPSFLAARRVERPLVGPLLETAKHQGWRFPELERVCERRSKLDRFLVFLEPRIGEDEYSEQPDLGYTDLAWLLVAYLNDDARRPAFERYLLSQLEGTRESGTSELEWFEKSFGISGADDWTRMRREVYTRIKDK